MKKFQVTLAGALMLGISAAATAASPSLYLGGQLGYQNIEMEQTAESFGYNSTTDYSGKGLAGGVFAGMKFDITPEFYLAPEINLGYSSADGGVTNDYGSGYTSFIEVEAKKTYGLAALAGYSITDSTDVYGRLGYQWTEFEATAGFTDPIYGNASESESKTFGGVRVGVGAQTAVAENLALRVDWSYTDYSSESFEDGPDTITYDPTESLFQVGVVYSF